MKFYIILGFLALIIFTSFSYEDSTHYFTSEGPYILEVVDKPTGSIKPVGLFLDPQWGVYQCIAEKRNLEYRMLLTHPNSKIVCAKWNQEEI